MKRLYLSTISLMLSVTAMAQTELILPLNATSLTEEQKTMNPVKLAYPTGLKDQMPGIVCFEPREGVFSISKTTKIVFSPGNLQYQASTDTWRFAEHQYDYVGDASNGNVYENGVKCDNSLISSTYNGWIDLFGWGTSGWNSGANAYQPYSTSENSSDYYPDGIIYNLTGDYAMADWGAYNAIHNGSKIDLAGTWRTLTDYEWEYLFLGRPNAENLFGHATIEGVKGIVILPDDWITPDGLTFVSSVSKGMKYDRSFNCYRGSGNFFPYNSYTISEWNNMEAAGAVFLSAAGKRNGTSVEGAQSEGEYRSSTYQSGYNNSNGLSFDYSSRFRTSYLYTKNRSSCSYGYSVRLAKVVSSEKWFHRRFSISDTEYATFSPGNLQYQASTNTWRFAEHQHSYVGDASQGNVYENGVKCDNTRISSTYDGWIDLFGWGTSGWNSGTNAYLPYSISENESDYYPGSSSTNNLTDDFVNADWGFYNAIRNGSVTEPSGKWRTLTKEEWMYLCYTRKNADVLKGQATVNGVYGFVLLPDYWEQPSELSFTAGTDVGWSANIYIDAQWKTMESAGAIFLPAAGERDGTAINDIQTSGSYWSSTQDSPLDAYYLSFSSNSFNPQQTGKRHLGNSVRLIDSQIKENEFSVSSTKKVRFSPGNLQYQASTGTWRFAEHQYDYVGDVNYGNVYEDGTKCNNSNISSSYSGWIDLFGWGTSGWYGSNSSYEPYSTTTTSYEYGPSSKDLTGDYNYADWGMYNEIHNGENIDPIGTWRTLSENEWVYLFHDRENAERLFGLGSVNGILGVIILPDDWVLPEGITFNSGTEKGLIWQMGTYNNPWYRYINDNNDNYTHNIYTELEWSVMELAGAVFLPAAGYRYGTSIENLQSRGQYWSSSYYTRDSNSASALYFSSSLLNPHSGESRNIGGSVRLVSDL